MILQIFESTARTPISWPRSSYTACNPHLVKGENSIRHKNGGLVTTRSRAWMCIFEVVRIRLSAYFQPRRTVVNIENDFLN